MPKTLMIIGGNWEQKKLVETAKNMGLTVILTDPDAACAAKSLADSFYIVEPRDLTRLIAIAQTHAVVGVIADECDYSHYAAVVIAHQLNLPNDGLAAAQVTTNKAWMREKVRDAAVMQPRFFACNTLEQAQQAMQLIGLPVIVKPVDNRGAFGISIVRDKQALQAAFLDALVNAHSRQVIVEAFVEGTHITVDGICDEHGRHHNLAMASKAILSGEKPVITDVIYPAQISAELVSHVYEVNQKVIAALGIHSGFSHSEYILDDKGRCFLVETANRGGGVLTSAKILPYLASADLYEFLIKQSLGEPAVLSLQPKQCSVLLSFFVFANGRVKSIDGVDTAATLPGVLHLQLLVSEGQTLSRPKNGAQRHGFVILSAANVTELEQLRARVAETFKVTYVD
ncbi:MAG TPA: ATP-grasp domain-containing protein [Marinagarivorans sp.]